MNPHVQVTQGYGASRDEARKQMGQHAEWRKPSLLARLGETWIVEVLGFTIAAGCLAGIVFLLRSFQDQRVPQWPVTLNFLISLLGTAASAGTLYGARASIAQLKWIWFARRPRPVTDLLTFERAKSSPVGALQLLFQMGRWLVTCPYELITI
jgi:hypothetical protein